MSYGEFSSTAIAVSGEIGWCSTMSKILDSFYIREARFIDIYIVAYCGLQPLACFLASEKGSFGCCCYGICDAVELLLVQAISGRSNCWYAELSPRH